MDYRQLLLLGLLRRQDMHGYQLNEFIEKQMHHCTDLKKPTAYYILDKLAQQGYVEVEQSQEGNRPTRRVYHITASGEAYFLQMLRANLGEYTLTYYDADVGLSFVDQLPPGEARELLRQKREQAAARLAELQDVTINNEPIRYVVDRNRRLVQAELEWLDSLLESLQA